MSDLFCRLKCGLIVTAVVGAVWFMGWAKAQGDLNTGYWPAEHPELFQWEAVGDSTALSDAR
jgi:hypothetical protein